MQKDRYEILGPLGFGATSRVDKARDKIIGRTVAIKTLVHSFGAAPQQKQFLREAQIVGQLSHPAIVNLYDVGVEETGIAYLVMEHIEGRTLQQVLSESPVPWPRACAWAADLASALGRAHQCGIIHGDVKPANIMVTDDGHVKLSDFGIARFATQVSSSGRIMGTPAYLAPEQILGEPHSSKSDLFSLGIVLYQMLTGIPPFDGSSVAAVCAQILSTNPPPASKRNPALPPGLDHIVMRCLAKDPAERYPSAEALAASLYPLSQRAPESVQAPVRVSWWSKPLQPRDAWTFAAVLLLAAGIVPAGRAFSDRFWIPPAPHSVAMAMAPKAPADLLGYSQAETMVANLLESSLGPTDAVKLRPRPPRAQKSHPARQSQSAEPVRIAAATPHAVRAEKAVPAPSLGPAISAAAPLAGGHAPLQIDISAVADGTLAIFADHTLLTTTPLHAKPAQNLHFTHVLSAGPHELRVVLYRPDKTLQVEKNGLGEIRLDGTNTLTIRVSRRSKLLVKHETALEVTWPTAANPDNDGQVKTPPLSASLK
jgi:serine/threonine protein kinase